MSGLAVSRWSATALTAIAAAGSAVLCVALGAAYLHLRSELALAQASDSLLDVGGAGLLAYVARLAGTPSDRGHPMGHGRAEPLGALAIAALSTLLAVEVARSAIGALSGASEVRLDGILLVVFVSKVVFKGALWLVARTNRRPAVKALVVDARNDVLVGMVAVAGFWGARAGAPSLDAWLALPLAVYIGWTGVQLARENIRLLMGASPGPEREVELAELASEEAKVLDVHNLRAQYLGSDLQVYLHITVPDEMTVGEGHDVADAVCHRLEAQVDVVQCFVHVDPRSQGGHLVDD